MRLKSRGLGRKELVMDFREYAVISEDDEAVIVGTIRDPVSWDFSIRVCEDDIVGMTKLILRPAMLRLLFRSLLRRRKSDHWNQGHDEHIAEGRKRIETAREKAENRVRLREERKEREENGGEPPAEAKRLPRRARTDSAT
jgi:hypothetical protein